MIASSRPMEAPPNELENPPAKRWGAFSCYHYHTRHAISRSRRRSVTVLEA